MAAMNLVLDLGNSFGKIAVCRGSEVLESAVYEKITIREIAYFNTRYDGLKGVIISSVVNDSREMIDYLGNLFNTCIELDHNTPIPLINRYHTPETLGYDRIAAAVGAYTIYPAKNVLVIDAGTAITFDLVTAGGEYLGGNISPGMTIRFKSLNKYTNRLPYLERPEEKPPLLGRSTKEAIQAGVVNGIIFELDGFIGAMAQYHPDLQVVLTGGDAKYFEGKLKNSIFVDLNLNLIGLNRILEHNASEKI
ncbi:MAG: type III pantothenate kinase [Bacteroidales bacterium]